MEIFERRELRWRTEAWRGLCERLSESRFRCSDLGPRPEDLGLDANAPADLTLDGVPCRSLSVVVGHLGPEELEFELTRPLPLIEFIPYRQFPSRPGDITYEAALARASDRSAVDFAEIRETETYWVFPVIEIGCVGVLVEKATGRVEVFGSYTEIDDWIWGYEQGLLDEPARDLVVVSVRDPTMTLRALKDFVNRPSIDALPATFPGCAGWRAIKPLRDAGDAFAWRADPAQ